MSKFFLTNDERLYVYISDLTEKSIFKKQFEYKKDGLFLLTTSKLDIQNNNAFSNGNDFAFATGTIVYKEKNDRKILFENRSETIESIRKESIGHYCIGLKTNNIVRIFGASYAAYDIYYYHQNNTFVISNDLYTIARVLKEKISINKLNLVEEIAHTILCNETVFNEIRRLDGNEYIEIQNNEFSIQPLDFIVDPVHKDTNNFATSMANTLQKKASIINKCFNSPSICMTAGLDARISLATYLSVGAKPNLYYGIGNSFLTNTQDTDLQIDHKFEEAFDLSFTPLKWETPQKIDQDWDEVINDYGFYAYIYGGSKEIFSFFRKLKGPICTFGYGGELYRNLDWMENRKKKYFSIEEFLDEYYITGDVLEIVKRVPNFREHLLDKLKRICKKYGLDPHNIANEDNFFFLQEYRKTADTHLLNFVNRSKYCNLLLMEPECLYFGRQSIDSLKHSKFMLSVINNLYSEVLNYPVFSHQTLRKYNKELGILEEPLLSKKQIIKKRIQGFLPQFLAHKAKKVKAKLFKSKRVKPSISKHSLIESNLNFNNLNDYRDYVKSAIWHNILKHLNFL